MSASQLFLRTIYRLKLLQALRRRAIFGVSYDFPKNYDFSDRSTSIYTYKKACISTSFALGQDFFEQSIFERRAESN